MSSSQTEILEDKTNEINNDSNIKKDNELFSVFENFAKELVFESNRRNSQELEKIIKEDRFEKKNSIKFSDISCFEPNPTLSNLKKANKFKFSQSMDLSVFSREFNPPLNFYDKKMIEKQRFESKIDSIRLKKEKEELNKLKPIPEINNKSRELAKNNDIPLQDRVKQVLFEKSLKVDQIRNKLKRNKSMSEETTQTSGIRFNSSYSKQRVESWVDLQFEREREKKHILEEIKKIKNEKEIEYIKSLSTKKNIKFNQIEFQKKLNDNLKKSQEIRKDLEKKYIPKFKPKLNVQKGKFRKSSSMDEKEIKINASHQSPVRELMVISDLKEIMKKNVEIEEQKFAYKDDAKIKEAINHEKSKNQDLDFYDSLIKIIKNKDFQEESQSSIKLLKETNQNSNLKNLKNSSSQVKFKQNVNEKNKYLKEKVVENENYRKIFMRNNNCFHDSIIVYKRNIINKK